MVIGISARFKAHLVEPSLPALDAFRDVAMHANGSRALFPFLVYPIDRGSTWSSKTPSMGDSSSVLLHGLLKIVIVSYNTNEEHPTHMALAYYSGLLLEENQHWHGLKSMSTTAHAWLISSESFRTSLLPFIEKIPLEPVFVIIL
ncbi:hypothetical protein VNO77_38940 [Canavalia gladiata]|uniref:Uncharacterized protein n=1 Tax=Canavalia gladiata TaxID=3824 RepID=A0AAN9PVD5_CANGL